MNLLIEISHITNMVIVDFNNIWSTFYTIAKKNHIINTIFKSDWRSSPFQCFSLLQYNMHLHLFTDHLNCTLGRVCRSVLFHFLGNNRPGSGIHQSESYFHYLLPDYCCLDHIDHMRCGTQYVSKYVIMKNTSKASRYCMHTHL